jgi:polysaccharide biosynthesis PFTS motif protein
VLTNLTTDAVPNDLALVKTFDFASWFLKSRLNVPPVKEVWGHCPGTSTRRATDDVTLVPELFPPTDRRWRFLLRAALTVGTCFTGVLWGRWWNLVLLQDLVLIDYVRSLRSEQLARRYIFHIGALDWRPLWTYVFNAKCIPTPCVLYSVNLESLGTASSGGPKFGLGWTLASWDHYAVWNADHEAFVKEATADVTRIDVVGPVDFEDSGAQLPALPDLVVALFDVDPVKDEFLAERGIPPNYYSAETVEAFLRDASETALSLGISIALKQKPRGAGKRSHPSYVSLVDELTRQPHVIRIDGRIAPTRLIQECAGVISIPFSAPAVIAAERGIPSVYYDPSGTLEAPVRARQGLPLLSSRTELIPWFRGLRQSSESD